MESDKWEKNMSVRRVTVSVLAMEIQIQKVLEQLFVSILECPSKNLKVQYMYQRTEVC